MLTPDQQFWWNWWVSLAVAAGTLLAVVVAIFGEKLRAKFFPPRLSLRFICPEGEGTTLTRKDSGEVADDVRYYHLRVSNERRWSAAREVQVFLTRVEEPGPNGDLHVVWAGEVPIRWRDQEVVPLLRTIGADADCDLCRVGRNTGLSLMPLISPNNLNAHHQGSCRLVASLQARSNETDSEVARIEISWDGSWEHGDMEMKRHLAVRPLAPERSN
ncbi:MAG: hypothetical protein ABSH05_12315 [Bryobacteraceae bacterium]